MVKFADILDNYIKLFPDDPRAREFKQTRDEHALWSSVEEWNQLVEGWKEEPAEAAPHDPKAHAEECGRFLTQHPATPDAAEIASYQKYLEAIDRRGPGPDSATAKIQRLFSDILVENLWMLKVRESETTVTVNYYLDCGADGQFCASSGTWWVSTPRSGAHPSSERRSSIPAGRRRPRSRIGSGRSCSRNRRDPNGRRS